MLIKNKNGKITLKSDGSYYIDGKNYYASNIDKDLYKQIHLIFNNKDEIDFNDIPLILRSKIDNNLLDIKKHFNKVDERDAFIHYIREFGIELFGRDKEENFLNELYGLMFDKVEFDKEAHKKSVDFFITDVEREKNNLALDNFIRNYKEGGTNDFNLFSKTVQEIANISDEKEIISLYNDKIDESFILDTHEFAFMNVAKKSILERQNKIIEEAIANGIDIPKSLPRFIAPSNKFRDIVLNPQKAKMIKDFNFNLDQELNSSKRDKSIYFDKGGYLVDEHRDLISKKTKEAIEKINTDINNNTDFITLSLLKNNGFSYSKFKEWAMADSSITGIKNISDAYKVINDGLLHCNRLVEAGILKVSGDGDFVFRSDVSRDILFENMDADYITLANKVIEGHSITFDANQKMEDKKNSIINVQKRDFFKYLDAQFESYYKVQNLGYDEFKKDLLQVKEQLEVENPTFNGEEYNFCKDMYPELFKSDGFDKIVDNYLKEKDYVYIRDEKFDFDKNLGSDLKNKFSELQAENRKKDADQSIKDNFRDVAIVKYNGVSKEKLDNYRELAIKNKKDLKAVDGYIDKIKSRKDELVDAGILKAVNENNFVFIDEYAKKNLFENLGADMTILKELNRGERNKIDEVEKKEIDKELLGIQAASGGVVDIKNEKAAEDNKQENKIEDLKSRFENFNFNYRYSRDKKTKKIVKEQENSLKLDFAVTYNSDENFRNWVDNYSIDDSLKDSRFREKFMFEIKDIEDFNEVFSQKKQRIQKEKLS